MISIVVVSHSYALATAAVGLAAQMVPTSTRPRIEVAAGLDETIFGTDAAAIAEAITQVDCPDGVLVMVDLGSAILSAEMALEFVDPEVAARVVISPAALVEGLVAALVTASTGASLSEVAQEACQGLAAKVEQLGSDGTADGESVEPQTSQAVCTGSQAVSADGLPTTVTAHPQGEAETATLSVTGQAAVTTVEAESMPVGASDDGSSLVLVWPIRNLHGLHARPAAVLVTGLKGFSADVQLWNTTSGRGPASAKSLTAVQTLGLRHGDHLRAVITGVDATQAYQRLEELAWSDFGELKSQDAVASESNTAMTAASGQTPPRPATRSANHPGQVAVEGSPDLAPGLRAQTPAEATPSPTNAIDPSADHDGDQTGSPEISASATGRQIVWGPAHHWNARVDLEQDVAQDAATEQSRLDVAVQSVVAALRGLGASGDQDIYSVQELLVADEATAEELASAIASGSSAVTAVTTVFGAAAQRLDSLDDPYLKARAEDQRGVMALLQRSLMGLPLTASTSGIVIVPELDPVTAGSLDPSVCDGIVTTSGGATGHGALVARARGFALVTGHGEAADVPDGTVVGLDPVRNRLWIDPSSEQVEELRAEQARRTQEDEQAAVQRTQVALTRSGRRVSVEANISSLADAEAALPAGAEGAGLVRTEVLFASWDHAPSAEEQCQAYAQIGQALAGQMITIRTWDPGGDKPLTFLSQAHETNPMLGERGIRVMRRRSELFDEQLTAILLASRDTPIQVMFPMIALPGAMAWARSRVEQAERRVGGHVDVGMMMETPAAALRAADFRDLADFISIGTNDLTQYVLAADRGNPLVAELTQADSAAVWDLIASAATAFAGRPVGVCGDLASHPDATERLVSRGVTSLSVPPPLIGLIKQSVRSVD
ncbi:MAG: HPr family phosphocarrier protein [Propionibacteriaceae bacterium]|nr:HPr family phosphocarrier protein [Propionibacteriaceae bacterium]